MNDRTSSIEESKLQAAKLAVYTAGYQGETIEHFIQRMLDAGIRRLVDVRKNPVSRKRGFSKSQLQALAAEAGIGYEHLPDLGVPSDRRRSLHDIQDFRRLFRYYEGTILPGAGESVERAAMLATQSPTVLICFEADWRHCHRSRLAQAIAARVQLEVFHL